MRDFKNSVRPDPVRKFRKIPWSWSGSVFDFSNWLVLDQSVLKEFIATWSLPTKFFIEIYDHVSKSDFGPLCNSSNSVRFRLEVRIWTNIRTIKKWIKIGFGLVIINFEEILNGPKSVHHVRMNSFKYFSGPKKGPTRTIDDNFRVKMTLSPTSM